jgi:hypothetical protein
MVILIVLVISCDLQHCRVMTGIIKFKESPIRLQRQEMSTCSDSAANETATPQQYACDSYNFCSDSCDDATCRSCADKLMRLESISQHRQLQRSWFDCHSGICWKSTLLLIPINLLVVFFLQDAAFDSHMSAGGTLVANSEWIYWEVIGLMSGVLGVLPLSVHTILTQVCMFLFMILWDIGVALRYTPPIGIAKQAIGCRLSVR